MSSRALRRIQGEKNTDLVALAALESDGAEEDDNGLGRNAEPVEGKAFDKRKRRKQKQHRVNLHENRFGLLTEQKSTSLELQGATRSPETQASPDAQRLADNSHFNKTLQQGQKKKKVKKKPKKGCTNVDDEADLGFVDDGEKEELYVVDDPLKKSKLRLQVEHRHLNPDNELKRLFGARTVLGCSRRQNTRQAMPKTWLVTAQQTWPRLARTGLSMESTSSKDGVHYFTFVHSKDYQNFQVRFWDAVESMEPNHIMALTNESPYHVDSLLQLSEICRLQEDQEMARTFLERALFSLESSFHPLFNLISGTCLLDYRRPENRSFFLALFKQMLSLESRGCTRTALEFSKLILSLAPEEDPLGILLVLDYLALSAKEYIFLTELHSHWEDSRNLSQLPNFAFSVPLAHWQLSKQKGIAEDRAAAYLQQATMLLQNALLAFPTVLLLLLDACGVQADGEVLKHSYFGRAASTRTLPALAELQCLYVGRAHVLWKDVAVLAWLEENTREVMRRVDQDVDLAQEAENKRQRRYRLAPRNLHRHVILSEVKEAITHLPHDVTKTPVLAYDPLPPLDSIISYTRPERSQVAGGGE
uniref:ribosome quality control complex subunit TCF25 isoform X2 n=1 Tax=Myxine glutinosa TaxID=7769 RepID=UPI00358F9CE4